MAARKTPLYATLVLQGVCFLTDLQYLRAPAMQLRMEIHLVWFLWVLGMLLLNNSSIWKLNIISLSSKGHLFPKLPNVSKATWCYLVCKNASFFVYLFTMECTGGKNAEPCEWHTYFPRKKLEIPVPKESNGAVCSVRAGLVIAYRVESDSHVWM